MAVNIHDLDLNDYEFGGSKDWIRAKDLGEDGEEGMVVTICGVDMGKNKKDDGTEEPQPIVKFAEFTRADGQPKKLGLNVMNRKALVGFFGTKMGAWIGKKIKIYTIPVQTSDGTSTMGIRIRAKLPPQGGGGDSPFGTTAERGFGPDWANAMESSAKAKGLSLTQVRDWLYQNDAKPEPAINGDVPNWPRSWMPTIKKLLDDPSLVLTRNADAEAVRRSSASPDQDPFGQAGDDVAPF